MASNSQPHARRFTDRADRRAHEENIPGTSGNEIAAFMANLEPTPRFLTRPSVQMRSWQGR